LTTNPFEDVAKESLGPRCSQFPFYVEGMVEAPIQLASVKVQLPLLNQTTKVVYCVYCYCEACQVPISWGGDDEKICDELSNVDLTQCSLMSLRLKYPSFASTLKEHVGSQKHCTMVNQQMGEALTALMGVVPGRLGRHASYNRRGNDVVVKAVDPVGRGIGAAHF